MVREGTDWGQEELDGLSGDVQGLAGRLHELEAEREVLASAVELMGKNLDNVRRMLCDHRESSAVHPGIQSFEDLLKRHLADPMAAALNRLGVVENRQRGWERMVADDLSALQGALHRHREGWDGSGHVFGERKVPISRVKQEQEEKGEEGTVQEAGYRVALERTAQENRELREKLDKEVSRSCTLRGLLQQVLAVKGMNGLAPALFEKLKSEGVS